MSDLSDPAHEAYAAAKRLAAAGAFAEALERHEWFHHHALEYCPSLYGVRLSFALSSWAEMGAKYPPALESLRRIRDRDTELVRLPGSSDHLFHDAVAINRVLGDNRITMILFREIEQAWPELARRRFRFMAEEAFKYDEDLFMRYTSDLFAYGEQLRDRHQDMQARMTTNMLEKLRSDSRFAAIHAHLRQKEDNDFHWVIQRLAALAGSAGQAEVAKNIMNLLGGTKGADHDLTA